MPSRGFAFCLVAVLAGKVLAQGTVSPDSEFSSILSGADNEVLQDGDYAVIAGGRWNKVTGTYANVAGGVYNVAISNFASVLGGYSNKATGRFATVLGGSRSAANGRYSLAAGFLATAKQDGSAAFGFSGKECLASTENTIRFCADTIELEASNVLHQGQDLIGRLAAIESTSLEQGTRLATVEGLLLGTAAMLVNVSARLTKAEVRLSNVGLPISCVAAFERGGTSGLTKIEIEGEAVEVYCDQQTAGGGWTLLVTSQDHSWTTTNVLARGSTPTLDADYSILEKADLLRGSAASFQYMIDAGSRGRWGGVWDAPAQYTFIKTDNSQTGVTLATQFDLWSYNDNGIEQRMPYLGATHGLLTTSQAHAGAWWGSLVSDNGGYDPAPYMLSENPEPGVIWYWVRARKPVGYAPAAQNCADLKAQGETVSGVATITIWGNASQAYEPQDLTVYCDHETSGGGWTLLVTAQDSLWTTATVLARGNAPTLDADYSILGHADLFKSGGRAFQFMIDAGSRGRWGGVWDAPAHYTFVKGDNSQTGVTLATQFDSWSYNDNGIEQRMPYLGATHGLLTTSQAHAGAWWGSLVSDNGSYDPAPYMSPENSEPGVIWYWMRTI